MDTYKTSNDPGRSFNREYHAGIGVPYRAVVSVCNHRTLGLDEDKSNIPQFTILIAGCKGQDLHRFRHALESTRLVVDIQVHLATDGGAALDDILAGIYPRPNLILLDCEMKFSFEIVRSLKENPNTRSIPLIALAQPGDDQYLVGMYRSHVNCVLPKPQTMAETAALFTRIEQFWLRVAALPVAR